MAFTPTFPGQMSAAMERGPRDPRMSGGGFNQPSSWQPPAPPAGWTPPPGWIPPSSTPNWQQMMDQWKGQRPDHVPGMGGGQMDAWRDLRPQRPMDPAGQQQMQDWRGLMPDRNGMHGTDWHSALDTWRGQMPGYQPPTAPPPIGQPISQPLQPASLWDHIRQLNGGKWNG